ncbi:hypothetical protein EX895_001532 [Sporisorium graminicola]|uniref:Xylanolytic transcriptional activator regulatory domain-containing protein n=1 Tax=Sporisorium graminicola TaxID=280036 RepID=A0A4U7KZI0_9BASI|nr:hypothetical protein EX895_001532 [Sporisorium graminicola]TKY89747.1 hypothetical protein EX895_001532 [Sporisorium graminicola]
MVGSHYVDDERVRAFPEDRHSRGMLWWQAAKNIICRNARVEKPLLRIQCLLLSTIFQLGLPISASSSWILLGGAIRVLLDVGAHRKHTGKKLGLSRIEEETYKRVFWVAYSLDRECAASLGRPIMLQDEDIDVELPVEIDDDYLFNTPDSEPLPAQPQDKPALISGFLCSLRLDEIVGRTLKTVYALHKTKIRFGINFKDWDERLVSEIDSALNDWLDTVPPRLRYDPHESNDEWLVQSSLLYSKYYNCQLLVHRPFIPAKRGASESSILNFPSLAICTNAARSISHLITNLRDRDLHHQLGITVAFRSVSASSILLMVVWGAKRNGGKVSSSASSDLRRSIDVLRAMEDQWQFCGKAVDILESIMTSTHVVVPQTASQSEQGTKRPHNGAEVSDVKGEEPDSTAAGGDSSGKQTKKAPRKTQATHVGSREGQPLAPEARHLPLSMQQLASLTPQSSSERSPCLVTPEKNPFPLPCPNNEAQPFHADLFGPITPQPAPHVRMPSQRGASGIPSSLSFGLMTPSSAAHWGLAEADYLNGPHSQATSYHSVPAVTPSIFDNLGLCGGIDDMRRATAGNIPDMWQSTFSNNLVAAAAGLGDNATSGGGGMFGGSLEQFYATQGGGGDTPQSDGSSGLTSYAFELLLELG